MQTGMPTPWLIRFRLSAAIALPSMSLLGLAPAARAIEEPHHHASAPAPLTQLETSRAQGTDAVIEHPSTLTGHRNDADRPLALSSASDTAVEATPAKPPSAIAASQSRPAALTTPRSPLSAAPRKVEAPSVRVLFSQASDPMTDEDEVFSPLPETDAPDEDPAPTVDDLIEADEAETEVESEADEANPETEDSGPTLDDLMNMDTDEDAEDAPELFPEPTPESRPTPESGDAVPIPAETVIDPLQYLDPNPNPLLIQTQPEEVEIIGTQPITLQEAIELSYRNNPDLRVARLELEQSRAALREAQAALFPTVSVNGQFQAQNTTETSSSFSPSPGGGLSLQTESTEELGFSYSAQAEVVYNIYSSGRRQASIRAAEEQVRLTELEVERRQEELRLNTVSEYYDLQAAIETIRINEAFLAEAERNLRDTRLREEVGVGTRFDVLRAEVQVANAQQDLVNSQRNRQVAQRTLARRLNVPPSLTITTVPVEIAGNWPLSLEESIVLAYQNRAELEQQLVQRDVNEQLRRAELAALGPQIDLFANYQISEILNQDDTFDDNYQLGARLSWTLYEGGAARARAQQRELDIEIAERNFEETRNTVRLAVESAYFNLQSNRTNIDTARLAVEQAREALELAILRFDAGVGTQLDILNAQSELTDAEVNLVQAVLGYNQSLAELQRAITNLSEDYYRELPY